jgi:hypothetical protein
VPPKRQISFMDFTEVMVADMDEEQKEGVQCRQIEEKDMTVKLLAAA